jgi:hypothetical protein
MTPPKCKLYLPATRYKHIEMRSLRYDSEALAIEIQSEGFAFARVVFQHPIGFRILDERDLCEFWENYHEKNGWFYEVEQGGWRELESLRSHFCAPSLFPKLQEYLLVGDKCISVFATQLPEIHDLGTNP